MWKESIMKAIRMCEHDDFTFYRCPRCNTIFSNMVVFTDWDSYDAVPRYCPCCRIIFTNGGDRLSD